MDMFRPRVSFSTSRFITIILRKSRYQVHIHFSTLHCIASMPSKVGAPLHRTFLERSAYSNLETPYGKKTSSIFFPQLLLAENSCRSSDRITLMAFFRQAVISLALSFWWSRPLAGMAGCRRAHSSTEVYSFALFDLTHRVHRVQIWIQAIRCLGCINPGHHKLHFILEFVQRAMLKVVDNIVDLLYVVRCQV